MSSPLASALLRLFSLFGVLMTKGEKGVISIHHFSLLVCNGRSCMYVFYAYLSCMSMK
jgi:hypothetical protein